MVNNRDINAGYDADGRQTVDPSQSENIDFYYDAAGMMWKTARFERYETLIARSGDGGEAKRSQRVWDGEQEQWEDWDHVYFISSSVTGRVVSEATKTGKKRYTYVAAGGRTIARQELTDTDTQIVGWQFRDATGLSSRGFSNEELNGLGNNVGILPNLNSSRFENSMTTGESPTFTNPDGPSCQESGVFMPCSMAQALYGEGGGTYFSGTNGLSPYPIEATGKTHYFNRKTEFWDDYRPGLSSIIRFALPDRYDEGSATVYNGGFLLLYVTHNIGISTANRTGGGVKASNDPCDISDLNIPTGVSLRDNIRTAENRFYGTLAAGLVFAGPGTVAAAGEHARWFIGKVNTGGDWDYKQLDPEGIKKGKSKYEDFGNFHYGVVAVAAGFDRGNTILRMAGYIHESTGEEHDGGEHGGLTSIVADFVTGKYGGRRPFRDQRSDQRMIRRGMAYYKARCHKK
ncbi:MAG: hypothetical protein KF881_07535 [Acidobacteria bacterium]|nr:hypothetical protein [Acidobacteriota bacterium]